MHSRSSSSRWPGRAALLLAGLLLADVVLFALLPVRLLSPAPPVDGGQPVAVAAILFNGFTPDRTAINAETRRRLHHGLSLLHSNRAERLLVAGGHRPDWGTNGARLMAEYLRQQGVAEERIIVEDQSRDTLGNLVRIRDKLRERGLQSAALVSSPHHLLRIRALASPAAEGLRLLPYSADGCDPPLSRPELWCSAHNNLAAWLAAILLPTTAYDRIVLWVRTHTSF